MLGKVKASEGPSPLPLSKTLHWMKHEENAENEWEKQTEQTK